MTTEFLLIVVASELLILIIAFLAIFIAVMKWFKDDKRQHEERLEKLAGKELAT